jgi:hypothetical protein
VTPLPAVGGLAGPDGRPIAMPSAPVVLVYDSGCPSGYRVTVGPPAAGRRDPTADAALARLERHLRRTVSGVDDGSAYLVTGRQVARTADRAEMVLLGSGRRLAQAQAVRQADGTWRETALWACSAY